MPARRRSRTRRARPVRPRVSSPRPVGRIPPVQREARAAMAPVAQPAAVRARGRMRVRGHDTRRTILDVARHLVSAHGYASTHIRDIQAATGLTKGAFYHHFRTKEEVVVAAIEEAGRDYAEAWRTLVAGATTPGGRLTALLDGLARLNDEPAWRNCRLLALLTGELAGADGALAQAVGRLRRTLVRWWADAVADAAAAGQMRADVDPAVAAEWIVCTMGGAVLARKAGEDPGHLRALMGAMEVALLAPGPR